MEDKEFQDAWEEIIKRINCMIKNNEEYKQPVIDDLNQFEKNWFYNNWEVRFRQIASFSALGTRGVIAIPNTTFEEWLYWFHEWLVSFSEDYYEFKSLCYEGLKLHEKHLTLHDKQIAEIMNRLGGLDDTTLNNFNDLVNRIEGLQQQINDTDTKFDKKTSDISNKVSQLTETVENIRQDLQSKIDVINSNIDSLNNKVERYNTDLTNRINSVQSDLLEKIETVQNNLNTVKSEIDNVLDTHYRLITDLQTDVANKYKDLNDKYTSLKSAHDTLQTNFNSLKSSYDESKKLLDAIVDNLKSTGAMNSDGSMSHAIAYGNINIFGGTADGNSYIRTGTGSHENDITAGM